MGGGAGAAGRRPRRRGHRCAAADGVASEGRRRTECRLRARSRCALPPLARAPDDGGDRAAGPRGSVPDRAEDGLSRAGEPALPRRGASRRRGGHGALQVQPRQRLRARAGDRHGDRASRWNRGHGAGGGTDRPRPRAQDQRRRLGGDHRRAPLPARRDGRNGAGRRAAGRACRRGGVRGRARSAHPGGRRASLRRDTRRARCAPHAHHPLGSGRAAQRSGCGRADDHRCRSGRARAGDRGRLLADKPGRPVPRRRLLGLRRAHGRCLGRGADPGAAEGTDPPPCPAGRLQQRRCRRHAVGLPHPLAASDAGRRRRLLHRSGSARRGCPGGDRPPAARGRLCLPEGRRPRAARRPAHRPSARLSACRGARRGDPAPCRQRTGRADRRRHGGPDAADRYRDRGRGDPARQPGRAAQGRRCPPHGDAGSGAGADRRLPLRRAGRRRRACRHPCRRRRRGDRVLHRRDAAHGHPRRGRRLRSDGARLRDLGTAARRRGARPRRRAGPGRSGTRRNCRAPL